MKTMKIQNYLERFNPWWGTNYSPKLEREHSLKRRFAFAQAQGYLTGTKLMLQIDGLRRLGKSTLMKQLVFDLIEKDHVSPSRIWFCEFSPIFNDLEGVLDSVPENSYIFLDEIQYCQHWRDILKLYYDLGKATRIIYSGSTAIANSRDTESLLGRFMPITIKPLTFAEYLYLKFDNHQLPLHYNQENFVEYLQYGEFPELLVMENPDQKQDYLRNSVLEPLFTKDVALYEVDKKAEFADLFRVVSADLGQVINKQNVAQEIQISRSVVDKYLKIFQEMGLVYAVPNYYKSIRQVLGSNKKIYTASINLSLAHIRPSDLSGLATTTSKGHIFENFILNELANTYRTQDIYYWRRQQKELDFVIQVNYAKVLAFEVKSKSHITANEESMYRRYAQDLEKEVVAGGSIDFAPVVWNFDTPESALNNIIRANDESETENK